MTFRTVLRFTAALVLTASTAAHALQTEHGHSGVVIGAPNSSSQACTTADFGAVQIRIGLFATLAACFRDVEMDGHFGTAFVTVPREFENRTVTAKEFEEFRAEVRESEDQFRRRAGEQRDNGTSARSSTSPIPLGVFDYTAKRVGYAYAYAVAEPRADGTSHMQTMMRTESFVLVGNRVVLLMIIAPVNDGGGASVAFDLSESWAKAIVSASKSSASTAKAASLN